VFTIRKVFVFTIRMMSVHSTECVCSQSGSCVFTVRKMCVHSQEVVCSQYGICVFTVRKLCVHSTEGVCSQSGSCVFTVRKVCVHSQEVCVHSTEGVCSQSGNCVFTVRKVCVHSQEVCVHRTEGVCSQSGSCMFTVRKVCVHSQEVVFTVRKLCVHSTEGVCSQSGSCVFTVRKVCSQSGSCVFTVRKVCSQSGWCVFTVRKVCVHRHIFSDNKMKLPLLVGLVPQYKFRETTRMLKTCFRIRWHVPYDKSNLRAISEVKLRRTLLTILQTFRTFSCARPVIGRTEPTLNSHITEKITQNFVLFPFHAHHTQFSAFLVFLIAFCPVRSKASQKCFRPFNLPLANGRSHLPLTKIRTHLFKNIAENYGYKTTWTDSTEGSVTTRGVTKMTNWHYQSCR